MNMVSGEEKKEEFLKVEEGEGDINAIMIGKKSRQKNMNCL